MQSVARALQRSRLAGGQEFPHVPEFQPLYDLGWTPRYGEMAAITARSGSGKSTLAMYYAMRSGLSTLYFSGDMSAYQAAVKFACASLHADIYTVTQKLDADPESVLSALPQNVEMVFGEITWRSIATEIDAFVELNNRYPDLIVIDNLMDIEKCATEYTEQSDAMQTLHNMGDSLGCAVWVLLHSTDKTGLGASAAYEPPMRSQIKNGLSEKPSVILSAALNPHTNEMQVALVKNRLGAQDASARKQATLHAIPSQSRFVAKGGSDGSHTGTDQRQESSGGQTLGSGLLSAVPRGRLRL